MSFSFFLNLAEASISLTAFALVYHFFLRRLTHFQWNRGYLLGSLLLSLILPLLPLPSFVNGSGWTQDGGMLFTLTTEHADSSQLSSVSNLTAEKTIFNPSSLPIILIGIYLLGCFYKTFRLLQQLWTLYRLISHAQPSNNRSYCLISSSTSMGPFSFLHYIILPRNISLSKEEREQVLAHEQVHVRQKHTLDLLLFSLAEILFWFHPAIYYLSSQLRQLHEFQVDASVIRSHGNIKAYGKLLIKLATEAGGNRQLLNTFSSKQTFNRITMLTQNLSNPMQKFRFLMALPVVVISVALSSFLSIDAQGPVAVDDATISNNTTATANVLIIGKISWIGNKAYSEAQLNKVTGLRLGDRYDKAALDQRINYNPEGSDLSSLYMDNGYLFFSVQPKETVVDNTVELAFTLSEGPQMKIGEVRISGNSKVSTAEVISKINMKPGELFSRAKVIKAQQAIQQMGHFNAEKIGINPIPNVDAGKVDIEFVLEEN